MRIYFDENFSPNLIDGMKELSGRSRDHIDVCSVEREFGRGTADEDWIPGIAAKHGVVITQDTNIHRTRAQWQLCQENKIGVFFIKPPKQGWNYWVVVQLVVKNWLEIVRYARDEKRPFGFVVEVSKSKFARL